MVRARRFRGFIYCILPLPFFRFAVDNFSLGCQQQRSSSNGGNLAAAAAAALEAAAWFGPNGTFAGQLPIVELAADDVTPFEDEDDDYEDETVQHLSSTFGAASAVTAVSGHANKQEQIFGE